MTNISSEQQCGRLHVRESGKQERKFCRVTDPDRHIKTQTEGSILIQTKPSEMSSDSYDYAVPDNAAIWSKNLQSSRFAESLMQKI